MSKNSPIYILGFSGLNDSIDFKKKHFPDFTVEELRIVQGMDAAAALLKDGKVVAAAEEERFNFEKHSNKFPVHAITYCLQKEGITLNDVAYIAHGFDYKSYEKMFTRDEYNICRYNQIFAPEVQISLFKKYFPDAVDIEKKFMPVKHHEAHAASAYFPSGFSRSLIVIIDGLGELYSISIYNGEGKNITPLKQYSLLNSLGMFYSIVTYHLGFSVNSDEYKVMGLAPYGDSQKYYAKLMEGIEINEKGETNFPIFLQNKTLSEKESYRGMRKWLDEHVLAARNPDDEIIQDHNDLAAALQYILNESIVKLVSYWQKETGHKNLCLAGGVTLNCTANGELLKLGIFEDVYIQPAAGDDGTAIGAALYKYHKLFPEVSPIKEDMPFYGRTISEQEITEALEEYKDQVTATKYSDEELLEKSTDLIMQDKVIGWFQGEMEFGPRALGHRSILADPRSPIMKDLINKLVKKREAFRPFAPSVIEEKAHEFFDFTDTSSLPYMLFVVPVNKQYRDKLPAITHIDGSARIQTVQKEMNLLYWKLISRFGEKTGIPILLNTSFNVKGQAIIENPKQAIETFLAANLHGLVIENYLILPK